VLDLFTRKNRKIVGWAMRDHMRTDHGHPAAKAAACLTATVLGTRFENG